MKEQIKSKIIEDYWTKRLAGYSTKIVLPNLKKSENDNVKQIKEMLIDVPYEINSVLKNISNGSGMALFILVFVSLQIELHKYIEIDDFVTGTVSPMKPNAVDTLVLYRNKINKDETLKELIIKTKQALLENFSYSTYDFEELYEVLNNKTLTQSLDILNIAFTYNKLQNQIKDLEKFDLNIVLNENDENMNFSVKYNTKLYDDKIIKLFCDNLLYILSNIKINLNKPIKDIKVINDEEYKKIIGFNNNEKIYPQQTLHGLFEEQVKITPDDIALIHNGDSITYSKLNIRANKLAMLLKEKGMEQGQTVGVLANISIKYVVGILAILKIGAVYMPMNPEDPSERINYIINDSGAKLVIVEQSLKDKINDDIETIGLEDYINYSELNNTDINPKNLAYVIYTSGSTGVPKGVMIKHESIVNQLSVLKDRYGYLKGTNHILLAPPTFDPSIQQIFWPLMLGGKLHLIDKSVKNNPYELLKYIITEKVDVVNTVPSLMNLMLDYADEYSDTKFKMIIIAGELFSKDLYNRLRAKFDIDTLINIYGPTEASINTTLYECKKIEEGLSIPIGGPITNYNVWILNEDKQISPIGVPGEIYISGIGLAKGYINNNKLTEEKFISCPFIDGEKMYSTGDLARWLPDGNIEFCGREDYQIKINGIRIELDEIRKKLITHPDVKDAVVIDYEGNYICAFIITDKELENLNPRDYLVKCLPKYMIPSTYTKIDSIPLTNNGKIDRKALLKLKEQDKAKTIYVEPEDDIELGLIAIWQKILNTDSKIGVIDNFYELGGNSLKTITMIAEIHRMFNIKLEVQQIFNESTIRGIKNLIRFAETNKFESIKPIDKSEFYQTSPSQKRMWVMDQIKMEGETFNIFESRLLTGKIEINYFQQALNELVARHESFRTTFIEVDNEIKQKISDNAIIPLVYLDFSNFADAEEKAKNVAQAESGIVFDLINGPLIKVTLIKIADEKHVFLLTMHHIISDTWSMGIIFNELIELYAGFLSNEKPLLQDMEVHYKDYAYWLNEHLSGEEAVESEQYWLNQFDGEIKAIDLPSDRPRKDIRGTNANMVCFYLSEELVYKIDEFSRHQGVTLFMTLLAVYYIWINKYTDEEDIIVNCLTSGRNHKGLENIVGFFVNTMPIRVKVDTNDTFLDFVKKIRKTMIGLYEHQVYSFDDIVEKLNIKRCSNRSLLTDIGFSANEVMYDVDYKELNDLKIDDFYTDKDQDKIINIDIFVEFLRESKNTIRGKFKYNTDLFDKPRIELMKERFCTLLDNLFDNQDEKISDISFITKEEQELDNNVDVEFDF